MYENALCIVYVLSTNSPAHHALAMDFIPFDIKELIASNLPGPDLINMGRVDSDFVGLFKKRTAPMFISEFIRIARIYKYLERLFHLRPSSNDIMEDGDMGAMSYILERPVMDDELFEDDVEYGVWNTLNRVIDTEPNMDQLYDIYKLSQNETYHLLDYYYEEIEEDIAHLI